MTRGREAFQQGKQCRTRRSAGALPQSLRGRVNEPHPGPTGWGDMQRSGYDVVELGERTPASHLEVHADAKHVGRSLRVVASLVVIVVNSFLQKKMNYIYKKPFVQGQKRVPIRAVASQEDVQWMARAARFGITSNSWSCQPLGEQHIRHSRITRSSSGDDSDSYSVEGPCQCHTAASLYTIGGEYIVSPPVNETDLCWLLVLPLVGPYHSIYIYMVHSFHYPRHRHNKVLRAQEFFDIALLPSSFLIEHKQIVVVMIRKVNIYIHGSNETVTRRINGHNTQRCLSCAGWPTTTIRTHDITRNREK
eukprot:gene4827-3466_t